MANPYAPPTGGASTPPATVDAQTAAAIEARIANLNSRSLGLGVLAMGMQLYGRFRGDVLGVAIVFGGLALLVYSAVAVRRDARTVPSLGTVRFAQLHRIDRARDASQTLPQL